MNCTEVQDLLSAYHDGELVDEQRLHVGEHLNSCSDCANELASFRNLTSMVGTLHAPAPTAEMWSRLEKQLDETTGGARPQAPLTIGRGRWQWSVPGSLAVAAAVLVVLGIGWFAVPSWFGRGVQSQFAAEFTDYLDQYHRDPTAAQQSLLARYDSQLVDPDQAIHRVGYRPVVADGLPEGYSLVSTHVMTMPCCTCVQSVCRRRDGSKLTIFEHDDDGTTEWFGEKPCLMAKCQGKECCLVGIDDQIASTWKRGSRHITLVGVRDLAEVNEMVAWMDEKQSELK